MITEQMSSSEKHNFWSAEIDHWLASGLTQRVFCEQKGHTLTTFCYWRKYLLSKEKPSTILSPKSESPIRFATVKPEQTKTDTSPASNIKIDLPNSSIQLHWPITAHRELAIFLKEYCE